MAWPDDQICLNFFGHLSVPRPTSVRSDLHSTLEVVRINREFDVADFWGNHGGRSRAAQIALGRNWISQQLDLRSSVIARYEEYLLETPCAPPTNAYTGRLTVRVRCSKGKDAKTE